ncbi:CTP pyrophosphohydrolase [Methanobrevibacter cuticularis]|uniref:CTP pyrophosphohydrolase n=1 Tax=Methanobrevibacter cuticularis TaxID=47311 RepID=A0A166DSY6_9EURY|nr:NUDIX domain-containing protein [Methanobrevibacter cuticularis]KZX15920.1 CTP pyrophosphohydrolase [Methanobrevibacter cuticularis]
MDIPYGLTMRGLLKRQNKILILKRHPNSRTNPNRWELVGGKVDPGENFDKALIREFKEETNLKIKIADSIGAVQEDFPHKRTVALVMNVEFISGEFKISDEHIDWKWANMDEIKELNLSGWFKKLLIEKNYEL